MSDLVIKVEGLSKLYRIGTKQQRYKTLRDTITDAFTAPFRRLASILGHQSSVVGHLSAVILIRSSVCGLIYLLSRRQALDICALHGMI